MILFQEFRYWVIKLFLVVVTILSEIRIEKMNLSILDDNNQNSCNALLDKFTLKF